MAKTLPSSTQQQEQTVVRPWVGYLFPEILAFSLSMQILG